MKPRPSLVTRQPPPMSKLAGKPISSAHSEPPSAFCRVSVNAALPIVGWPMLSIAGLGIAFRAKPLVRQNARQAISTLGLDGILYLLGVRDRDLELGK